MKKGNLTGGLILILLGAWFLAVQFVPQLNMWAKGNWTLSIIGLGVIFLLVSVLTKAHGFSIPAFIVGGIGGILYYQNVTADWDSWAYVWTLIPGFVGLGLLFFSLQTRQKDSARSGLVLLIISAVFFFVFGSFLGAPKAIIRYWPILLIFIGLWSMLRSLFGRKAAKVEPPVSEQIPDPAPEPITAETEETETE